MEMTANSYTTEDLLVMREAKNYTNWIIDKMNPYLGSRILEVGAGIGNYTGHLKRKAVKMYAIDIDPIGCNMLKQTYPDLDVMLVNASNRKKMMQYADKGIDTVVCLNVLEHIDNDIETLENFYHVLIPGGRAIVLVPALPKIYGTIDEKLMHKRRYTRSEVIEKMKYAGFIIEESHYMNSPAVFGWYLNNKVFKKTKQSQMQVKIYDFLIPLIREIEHLIKPKVGLSVFAVGKKS